MIQYPMTDGLLFGALCPACKFLVRGVAYEQAIANGWTKTICKCKTRPLGDSTQLSLFPE
jgi:hypothetical protein